MRTIAAAKCKATFLSVLTDVEKKREPVLVTRHGKPVAKMVPLELADEVDPLDAFRFPGVITIHGDIMSPMYTDEEYEQFYQESLERKPVILIDTHVALWATHQPALLSTEAARIMAQSRAEGGAAIADITLRELAFLAVRKRISISTPLDVYLDFVGSIFRVLPIDGRIADRSLRFASTYPKDPADQIIGATAIVHGLTLVTKDVGIRRSGEVDCVW